MLYWRRLEKFSWTIGVKNEGIGLLQRVKKEMNITHTIK
jgi:hypothetical protein